MYSCIAKEIKFCWALVSTPSLALRRNITLKTPMRYITQKEALSIDKELTEKYLFSIPQLMELAGLSVSHAVYDCYKPKKYNKVLVCAGPGNNGGDGFVVARNLSLMGYQVAVYYPKESPKEYVKTLAAQMPLFDVNLYTEQDLFSKELEDNAYDLIIDAVFGFSFKPPLRPPFDFVVSSLSASKTPICSIDVPSGWFVDAEKNEGELDHSICIQPETIVCLTAPKICIKSCIGKNLYLGGRFMPSALIKQYNMDYPPYPDEKIIVKLSSK